MKNKKDDKVKIEVSTYNWGPCVVKVKILDDFKKVLLEEARKNEEDYASKLAGQIRKETGYSEESRNKIIPYLSPYLGVYNECFQRHQNKKFEHGAPEYVLSALWVNYQRKHEFNPPHDHDGKLSFVTYLSIPDELKKEHEEYKGKSCGPGGIQFVYGDGPRDCITYQSFFPEEGDMYIFPAWLKHWVAPFKSNCTRISVSGNVHDSAPLNAIQGFAPEYLKGKSEKKQ